MGFEEFTPEKQSIKRQNEKKRQEKPMSRRRFLHLGAKAALGAVVGVAAGKPIVKGLKKGTQIVVDKINDELDQDKDVEIRVEKKEKSLPEKYLAAYYELSRQEKYFPEKIFEKDLLIAQQCQESRYEIDARSHAGASGVMQNMNISVIDVNDWLNMLARKGEIEWDEKKLDASELKELEEARVEKSDYSRALGKLHLMQLWTRYKAGRSC